jgi:hypothetical protein
VKPGVQTPIQPKKRKEIKKKESITKIFPKERFLVRKQSNFTKGETKMYTRKNIHS